MYFATVVAATLLALVPSAYAANATVVNKCGFPVYMWVVDADRNPSTYTKLPPGGMYTEQYRKPSYGGVSLKLSSDQSCSDPITQFEYTLDGFIWYDISNVNCHQDNCPFQPYGMHMVAGPGCPTRTCQAGVLVCTGAYNQATDDINSLACDSQHDITLWLCTEQGGNLKREVQQPAVEIKAPAAHRRHIGHPHWRR